MGSLLPNPALAGARYRTRGSRVNMTALVLSIPLFGLLYLCLSPSHLLGPAATGLVHDISETTPSDAAHADSASTFLYVASYGGSVTTLKLTKGKGLQPVAMTEGCAASPSWLTLDATNSVLYCTDEGLSSETGDGSLSSFRAISDGSLVRLDRARTISGPVSLAVYGKDRNGIAVAHYGGSALTSWDVKLPTAITPLETRLFKMGQPGPNRVRQDAPHPHAAVVDPTGKFILVPDLGADLVRVYVINHDDLTLQERDPLVVAPGSGPRHISFADKGKKTFMYLVTELGNTVVGYEVSYNDDALSFKEVWTSGIHGKGKDVPKGAAASEIIVTPDSNFLILSSRNENTLEISHPDPNNSTRILSDPLVNFAIDSETGHLNLIQEVPCGGRFPRQFSMNKAGSLVAVALQSDSRVVVMERNVETGELGEFIANAEVEGEATTVIFSD